MRARFSVQHEDVVVGVTHHRVSSTNFPTSRIIQRMQILNLVCKLNEKHFKITLCHLRKHKTSLLLIRASLEQEDFSSLTGDIHKSGAFVLPF